MDTHKNARLTPKGREDMVRAVVHGGLTKAAAARRFNTTAKTVAKWVDRFNAEGLDGLRDRSSRPLSSPGQIPLATCTAVEALRRQRYSGKQIASELTISPATVSRILRRLGLNKLSALEPAEPIRRYERDHPGDASRIAFVQVMPDDTKQSAVAFLNAAVAYYESLGVKVARVMTDNGGCYRALAFRDACRALALRHIRTRPYTPRTNGKAERFIQTALREWAYAKAYLNSDHRKADLPLWLHRYNWHRPHGSLKAQTPISRLGLSEDNLLRLHN
jgi:transposase InsO family protein